MRLSAFSEWQARRAAAGWRIWFSENSDKKEKTLTVPFDADGEAFTLRGRIDRIDYHADLRILSVLDYKTADAGLAPDKTHRRSGQWIDLQLPLYRHLLDAPTFKLPRPRTELAKIELGYILLPKDSGGVMHALAGWDEDTLESADEVARAVIADLRAEKFWPPKLPPPVFSEDVAAICQDHRLGSWRAASEGDAA